MQKYVIFYDLKVLLDRRKLHLYLNLVKYSMITELLAVKKKVQKNCTN